MNNQDSIHILMNLIFISLRLKRIKTVFNSILKVLDFSRILYIFKYGFVRNFIFN